MNIRLLHPALVASSLLSTIASVGLEVGANIPAVRSLMAANTDGAQNANDRRATDFVQSELDAHWAKVADGWTTKFQRKNAVGDVLPGEPDLLYRQFKELSFTLEPRAVTDDEKLAGTDYIANVEFEKTQERSYRKVDMEDGPKGWSSWRDASISPLITVERRHGKWMLNADDLLKGVRPNASQVPAD